MLSYILGWWQYTVREKCGEKEAIEYEGEEEHSALASEGHEGVGYPWK